MSAGAAAMQWPAWPEVARVLSLADYNTRVVVIATTLLGVASGAVGSFMLLRKRALVADALSHATLPGIVVAFMIGAATGVAGGGKSLALLLLGGALGAALGGLCLVALRRSTRLKDDAALGIVLSVFFGAGVALLSSAQRMGQGHAAGLESFIYGKTASVVRSDAVLIGACALACLAAALALFKELRLVCFDEAFARSIGLPAALLDAALLVMLVVVTIAGLQAVGLVLVIALLVIPAAAARFWTDSAGPMVAVACGIGGACSAAGAALSALLPDLPSGAMIVLVAAAGFFLSALAGARRGVVRRWLRRRAYTLTVERQHLLRAILEAREERGADAPVPVESLERRRVWAPASLRSIAARARRAGLVASSPAGLALTREGLAEAERVTRRHRLWELYLISEASVAPSHVDRDADDVEHVLPPELVAKLEARLAAERAAMPASPHAIGGGP